jgi:hypothetical protein
MPGLVEIFPKLYFVAKEIFISLSSYPFNTGLNLRPTGVLRVPINRKYAAREGS